MSDINTDDIISENDILKAEAEQRVPGLYALLLVGLFLSALPFPDIQGIAFIFITILLIAGYVFKKRYKDIPLAYAHTRHYVKLIWLMTGISAVALAIWAILFNAFGDQTAVNQIFELTNDGQQISMSTLRSLEAQYKADNAKIILILNASIFMPLILGFMALTLQGYMRFKKMELPKKAKAV